jgi:hypothetical protein
VLFLAGASVGVAIGLAVLLPDACPEVTPHAGLTQVGATWRDGTGDVVLWIDREGDAHRRRACAD